MLEITVPSGESLRYRIDGEFSFGIITPMATRCHYCDWLSTPYEGAENDGGMTELNAHEDDAHPGLSRAHAIERQIIGPHKLHLDVLGVALIND